VTYLFDHLYDLAKPGMIDSMGVGIGEWQGGAIHILRSILARDVLWCISATKVMR
jgi:hypothetical protein